jgi:hypothetical protein
MLSLWWSLVNNIHFVYELLSWEPRDGSGGRGSHWALGPIPTVELPAGPLKCRPFYQKFVTDYRQNLAAVKLQI